MHNSTLSDKLTSTAARYVDIATAKANVAISAPDSTFTKLTLERYTTQKDDGTYYTFTAGGTDVTINKSGLYFLSGHVYVNLDASTSGGGILCAIRNGSGSYLAESRSYIYGLSDFTLSVSNLVYITAGTKIHIGVNPSAYMTGTAATTIKGGYIQIKNLW